MKLEVLRWRASIGQSSSRVPRSCVDYSVLYKDSYVLARKMAEDLSSKRSGRQFVPGLKG